MSGIKKTPLNAAHRGLGAKMVDFGGWDMPVQYSAGILAEHEAVRNKAGLFDVSHMGELRVVGKDALKYLQYLTPNDVSALSIGQIHYTAFLYENGTFVDDLLIYKEAEDEFLLVVNAGNIEKDFHWALEHVKGFDVRVTNESDATAEVALQGPLSEKILQPLCDIPLCEMGYYYFRHGKVAGVPALVSRTGYTGEDGFEVYVPAEAAEKVWHAIMDAGSPLGLIPAGLGARNTLRLECRMSLYGHEINDTTNALEAGLGWIVKMDKDADFIGKKALAYAKAQGLERRVVGFRTAEKRDIARDGMSVVQNGERIGYVTSGGPCATVGANIGLAYVPVAMAAIGGKIQIDIRGRAVEAEIIPTPFYKRKK
ncbi:MAG: glycine cleavage system aminomethyltransferase GcvT [Holophagaceae bacterium]|nr:glycine cleavage system aminomethyltransferase GcvT [Holophagaceae bacterium]